MRTAKQKTLGIYVHVPFCRSKCEYCDFYSIPGGRNSEWMAKYLQAVLCHIREAAPLAPNYTVDSVYFGGGTPTFFGAEGLERIFAAIAGRFRLSAQAEVSLEANPDSVNYPMLARLHRAGFNRISIGVQSDDDAMLKKLGRPHTFAQAERAVEDARRGGFENVSLDLMYGLPGQTAEQWKKTLDSALALSPDHLSCYGLKVEEGTPLWSYRDCANLPDDDAQADQYLLAVSRLERAGFRQYEISNFAREGFACRHNLKYWLGDEYLGFGPTAASDFAGKRFTVVRSLEDYADGILNKKTVLSECETIPLRERAGEYVMLRLRTARGIEAEEYTKSFLLPFEPLEEALELYARRGLAKKTESGRWRLTPEGFLVSNSILVELLEKQQQSVPLAKKR